MVVVRVTEQNSGDHWVFLPCELLAKTNDSCTRIENDVVPPRLNLDTSGVAAKSKSVLPWDRVTASDAPESDHKSFRFHGF
jgi:hypothetical protein